MPIYTKTGDRGMTGLYGGRRVLKSDPIIDAGGAIDELSSLIGLVSVRLKNKDDSDLLTSIQKDLYAIMAFLSGSKTNLSLLKLRIKFFEQNIDRITSKQTAITRFILPGGTEIASWFHVLRTVCRRTERRVVNLKNASKFDFSLFTFYSIIKYLNRLSDLFFVLARKYNQDKEILV